MSLPPLATIVWVPLLAVIWSARLVALQMSVEQLTFAATATPATDATSRGLTSKGRVLRSFASCTFRISLAGRRKEGEKPPPHCHAAKGT